MQKNRRLNWAPIMFLALCALLIAASLLFGMRALNTWSEYDAESRITPVPTATVHAIKVTRDPALVTNTPAPTALYMASGSAGAMVSELQEILLNLGFYTGVVDGQFGSGTRDAVKLFQQQHSLTADGIVGQMTWDMLHSGQVHRIEITPTPPATDTLAGNIPMLVNRENPIPEGFYPRNLVRIQDVAPEGLFLYKIRNLMAVEEAVNALIKMVQDATSQGIYPWQISEGYRTYEDQKDIFDNYVNNFMEDGFTRSNAVSATRQTVADPGQSEHHTGLAFDLTVPGEFFSDTAQYAWLATYCWDYGFIMRYTDDKQDITGFLGEEWHVRYVGLEHSKKMQQSGMCLEEYLQSLGY